MHRILDAEWILTPALAIYPAVAVRMRAAHRGYARLLEITSAFAPGGFPVQETITSGTPGLPCALSYAGFKQASFVHRVSPGTLIYHDVTSLKQLPAAYGLAPAAVIVAPVISQPTPNIVTCGAGHKTVSVDCGLPNGEVLGRPELVPLTPGEEHLPIEVPAGAVVPAIREMLYLVPRHVCPTPNNFDDAVIVRAGTSPAWSPSRHAGGKRPYLSLGIDRGSQAVAARSERRAH